jgi:hypothetical protein
LKLLSKTSFIFKSAAFFLVLLLFILSFFLIRYLCQKQNTKKSSNEYEEIDDWIERERGREFEEEEGENDYTLSLTSDSLDSQRRRFTILKWFLFHFPYLITTERNLENNGA